MLNELETDHLAAMVDAYGIKGLIAALATEATKRSDQAPDHLRGAAWGHDAVALRRVVSRFWTTGG